MTKWDFYIGGIYCTMDIGSSILSSIVLNEITDVLKDYDKKNEMKAILLLVSMIFLFLIKAFA